MAAKRAADVIALYVPKVPMTKLLRNPSPSSPNRPSGVIVLALLLFLVGGIWLLAAIILPIMGVTLVPWYVYLAAAAYFLIVGWGLWDVRRWAYVTALLMCVVLFYYLLQTAIILQQNVLLPFVLVAAIFGYLLQSRVRVAFLAPPGGVAAAGQPAVGDDGQRLPDAQHVSSDKPETLSEGEQ
jgi:hypothetical protein